MANASGKIPTKKLSREIKKHLSRLGEKELANRIGLAPMVVGRIAKGLGVRTGSIALAERWIAEQQ